MKGCIIKSRPSLKEARYRNKNEQTLIKRDEIVVSTFLRDIAKGKKYFIRTYGCQANVRDEETMKGILELAGYECASDAKDADLVILNTCAVRENAEDRVYGEIGQLKGLKNKKKDMIIALGGCMIQEPHIVETIEKSYRHVDLLFGTHNIHQLLEFLEIIYREQKRVIAVESKTGEVIENTPTVRLDKKKAYVNIMYGCDKFCTYCIVPYTRGKQRSRELEDILNETKELLEKGYLEITYLGQNVNAYGKDLPNGVSFATLLEQVALLGVPRIKFMTSHPWDFSDEMIDVIARYDSILPFIHLPVQSGNDEVLRKMGRRYTSAQYLELVNKMRAKIKGLALSTDIIVGFPNETDEQFEDTIKIVKAVGYDSAFTFIYSPRVGTPAASLEDKISDETKHIRFDRLVEAVEEEAIKKAEAMIGKVYSVLVEGTSKRNKEVLSGYTETNKLVHFKGDMSLVGTIVKVKITESHLYSMLGEIVDE